MAEHPDPMRAVLWCGRPPGSGIRAELGQAGTTLDIVSGSPRWAADRPPPDLVVVVGRQLGPAALACLDEDPRMGGVPVFVADDLDTAEQLLGCVVSRSARSGSPACASSHEQEFVRIVSHDLHEPVRMVTSFSALLARSLGSLSPEQQRYLDFVTQESKRLADMLGQLLTYSRLATRQRAFATVPLDGVVARVKAELKSKLRGGTFTVEGGLPMVHGDAEQLTSLFRVLLSNAIQYAGDGPPRIDIVRGEGQASGFVLVEVRDRGIGIPRELCDDAMLPFRQLHARGTYPGLGMGLAIARRIAVLHGGSLWLEPRRDGGLVALLSLPETRV